MNKNEIVAHRITKPVQLLVALFASLAVIDGLFLTAARFISAPDWAPGVLVAASVINVPVFLAVVVVLQTRYRAEMQDDTHYNQYLRAQQAIESRDQYARTLFDQTFETIGKKLDDLIATQRDSEREKLISEIRGLKESGKLLRAQEQLTENLRQEIARPENKSNVRILHVEDNRTNQMIVKRLLETSGYTVDSTDGGNDALHYLEKNNYDLILLDTTLPDLDSIALLKIIREREAGIGSRTPILALSADNSIETKLRFAEAGLDAFLSKPATAATLLNKVRMFTEEKRTG